MRLFISVEACNSIANAAARSPESAQHIAMINRECLFKFVQFVVIRIEPAASSCRPFHAAVPSIPGDVVDNGGFIRAFYSEGGSLVAHRMAWGPG
jgi:hypothetical protein